MLRNKKLIGPSLEFFVAMLADFPTNLCFLTAMKTRQCRVVSLKVGNRFHSGASRECNQREHAKCDEQRHNKPPENHHGNRPSEWGQFEASAMPVSHKVRLLPTMSSKKTLRREIHTSRTRTSRSGKALKSGSPRKLQFVERLFDDAATVF